MTRSRADIWIYGRTEKEYASSGSGGLRPLWWSDGVDANARHELKKTVECFQKEHGSRLQFFRLADGRPVLTRTLRSLDEKYVDHKGRETFACYAWIIDRVTFREFDNNPFQIAEPFGDLSDIGVLIERYGMPGSLLEKVSLCSRTVLPSVPELPGDELAALEQCAYHAMGSSRSPVALSLIGDASDCESLLSWIFARIPIDQRLECTFSNQADECKISEGLFWAVGGTNRRHERASCEVRLGQGIVGGQVVPSESSHGRRYFRWLQSKEATYLPSGPVLDVIMEGALALEGSRGPRTVAAGNLDEEQGRHLADLFAQNREDLSRELVRRLRGILSRSVATRLARFISRDFSPQRALHLLDILSRYRLNEADLLDDVEQWMASSWPDLDSRTERRLRKAARKNEKRLLEFWLICRGSIFVWLSKANLLELNDGHAERVVEPLERMRGRERRRFDRLIKKFPALADRVSGLLGHED